MNLLITWLSIHLYFLFTYSFYSFLFVNFFYINYYIPFHALVFILETNLIPFNQLIFLFLETDLIPSIRYISYF